MLIFPEIQISKGRLVTRKSRTAENIVYDQLPLDAVRSIEAQGAERLHVLDVDAALGRDETNAELIHEILASTEIPVQVAGGMRTAEQIDSWLEAGAAQVVLGTLAIINQPLLAEVCTHHPGAILANVATKGGYVMIDGWQTQTAFTPVDIVYDLQMAGVAGIIHFDIDRFEEEAATSLALTMEMKKNTVIPIYSSGTVHSLDDVARLRYLPDIHGAIVGKAILEGVFTLREALEVAAQNETRPEPDLESTVSPRGIHQPLKVYLASYHLSLPARWWNVDLRQVIADDNPYVDIVIPQEDLEIDQDRMSPREVQAAYEEVVEEADTVIVLLDGIEDEAWTAFECGFARARGKYLLGIASAAENASRSRFEAMCDEVVRFDPEEDRSTILATLAKSVNTCLLAEGIER
jgi:phosphoribosylformimino-5-aminoimidazole carboxamide ribotide isomerase